METEPSSHVEAAKRQASRVLGSLGLAAWVISYARLRAAGDVGSQFAVWSFNRVNIGSLLRDINKGS